MFNIGITKTSTDSILPLQSPATHKAMQLTKLLTSLAILALSAKSGLAAPVPEKAFRVDPHCVEWSHRKQYCYKYEDGWDHNGKIEPGELPCAFVLLLSHSLLGFLSLHPATAKPLLLQNPNAANWGFC